MAGLDASVGIIVDDDDVMDGRHDVVLMGAASPVAAVRPHTADEGRSGHGDNTPILSVAMPSEDGILTAVDHKIGDSIHGEIGRGMMATPGRSEHTKNAVVAQSPPPKKEDNGQQKKQKKEKVLSLHLITPP